MRTFFLGLILGILAGSLVTVYISSPEAYEKLKVSKNALLERDPGDETPASPEEPVEEASPEVSLPEETPPQAETPVPVESSPPEETHESDAIDTATADTEPVDLADAQPSEETLSEESAISEPPKLPAEDFSIEEPAKQPDESVQPEVEEASEPEPTAQTPSITEIEVDRAIKSEIERQLALEPQIDGRSIHVRVEDGIVLLSGKVSSGEVAQLAIEIALDVEGVDQVKSELETVIYYVP